MKATEIRIQFETSGNAWRFFNAMKHSNRSIGYPDLTTPTVRVITTDVAAMFAAAEVYGAMTYSVMS